MTNKQDKVVIALSRGSHLGKARWVDVDELSDADMVKPSDKVKLFYADSNFKDGVEVTGDIFLGASIYDLQVLSTMINSYDSLGHFVIAGLGKDLEPRVYERKQFKQLIVDGVANGIVDPFDLLTGNGGVNVKDEWFYCSDDGYIYSMSKEDLDQHLLSSWREDLFTAVERALDTIQVNIS